MHKGQRMSLEGRRHLSEINSGEKHPQFGTKHSPETIRKMSIARKKNPTGRIISSEEQFGSDNISWKGDNVKYRALHKWVREYIAQPIDRKCTKCHNRPAHDIANISKKFNPYTYTRDFKNWFWLCRSCHVKYDRDIK